MGFILTAAAALAATALVGAGLDAKYSIREDVAQIRTALKHKQYFLMQDPRRGRLVVLSHCP